MIKITIIMIISYHYHHHYYFSGIGIHLKSNNNPCITFLAEQVPPPSEVPSAASHLRVALDPDSEAPAWRRARATSGPASLWLRRFLSLLLRLFVIWSFLLRLFLFLSWFISRYYCCFCHWYYGYFCRFHYSISCHFLLFIIFVIGYAYRVYFFYTDSP